MTRDRPGRDVSERERGDPVDRVERRVTSRRDLLLGAAVGATGVGGLAGASVFVEGAPVERLATLASGALATPTVRYALPAVDAREDGLVVGVTVTLTDGAGDLYVDLDGIEVRHDVQLALREAAARAQSATESSLGDRDVLVSFDPPGDGRLSLRGKSWEAGLFVALAGVLTARTPSAGTLVTGILDSEGALLPVGGIEAKARAARRNGAETLLVPPGRPVSVPGIVVEPVERGDRLVRRVFE